MALVILVPPAKTIRRLIIDMGLCVSAEIFYSKEPDQPENCVTVTDTVGRDDGSNMDGEMYEQYGFQVRVRHEDYDSGYEKVTKIATELDTQVYDRSVQVGANVFQVHCVNRVGSIIPLGQRVPTSKRNLFTFNALVLIKRLILD